jgi:hypothetical protein
MHDKQRKQEDSLENPYKKNNPKQSSGYKTLWLDIAPWSGRHLAEKQGETGFILVLE